MLDGMLITFSYAHVKYRSVATTLIKLPKTTIRNHIALAVKTVMSN